MVARTVRWCLGAAAVGAAAFAGVAVVGADGQQPPPGVTFPAGEAPPLGPQPPPGVTFPPGEAPTLGTQPPNPDPELTPGPPAQLGPQPEVEGSGDPSPAGEVETAVVGRPD